MNGYYISKDKAEELGLVNDPIISKELQNTIIVITENDVNEYQDNQDIEIQKLSQEKINNYSNWFYSNYYDNLMESFIADM